MPDGQFKKISLESFKGKKYVLLFFYPLDFTFVCPSEIVAFDKSLGEFEKRDVQVIGCSIDSNFVHSAWKNTPLSKGGIGDIKYPLLADLTKEVSKKYGVLLEDQGMALRGLFLIDKDGILQHSLINNLPIGRSVEEAIRVVDALQFHEAHGDVCPANWKQGSPAMKPTAKGVAEYLSKIA